MSAFGSPSLAPPFDPRPALAYETAVEDEREGLTLGYEHEEKLVVEEEPMLPVPPPGTIRRSAPVRTVTAPESNPTRHELLVDVEVPEPLERGHVRSPVLAR